MRTYFRQTLADEALLSAAYSAESVLIEIIFIFGPLIVALLVAFATPSAAVWFAAACGFAGTLLFLRTRALRAWRVEARTTAGLLGPLAAPRFVKLVAVVLCFATAFGFLEIGLTAYAIERSDAAFAGVLLGLMSAGSALGGLAYGSRGWHFPLARQFAFALALTALGLAVLSLRWQPWISLPCRSWLGSQSRRRSSSSPCWSRRLHGRSIRPRLLRGQRARCSRGWESGSPRAG
jgi:hypothetical protein